MATNVQIQLTLDEHQAVLDAKAKELADMIGEVSIKTVDETEFEEGAIRNKAEVEEEGYMGGKVGITRAKPDQRRTDKYSKIVGWLHGKDKAWNIHTYVINNKSKSSSLCCCVSKFERFCSKNHGNCLFSTRGCV